LRLLKSQGSKLRGMNILQIFLENRSLQKCIGGAEKKARKRLLQNVKGKDPLIQMIFNDCSENR